MKSIIFALIFFVFIPVLLYSQDITTKKVIFKKGTTSKTVSGTIKGRKTIDYTVDAKAGQTFKVELITKSGSLYFNLLNPNETEVAYYNSSNGSNSYEGKLTVSGEQKIRVYLIRSDARRNASAKYKLKINVVD